MAIPCRLSLVFVVAALGVAISACADSHADQTFTGKWMSCGAESGPDAEITKQGDYYLWKDDGGAFTFGDLQFKLQDGELKGSNQMMGNMTFNKQNGRMYFFSREYCRPAELLRRGETE